ncbi:MAG: ABC transporter substrate-binding protein, partial [Rhodoglobus sp.]|nr:ABC transporter substrate-binding protein [Rhodoglobus sp.]
MLKTRTLVRAVAALGAAVLAVSLAACAPAAEPGSDYVTEGKLTIGTGEPAYYPWVIDDAPESGEGFEAAIAYAVAEQLGFSADDVVWVRTTFDEAIAPGPKNFDFNLQQFSITDERKQNVDFSSAYYETTQVVITTESSKAAGASSLADLKELLIGAATGTTSFDAIEQQIAPTAGAQAFNSNDDAKLALESGTVDAIVVDLPTAFYLTGVELTGGLIIGQLPKADGKSGDEFGLVLAQGSALTAAVAAAVDALRDNGTLQQIADTWLADAVDAPVLMLSRSRVVST